MKSFAVAILVGCVGCVDAVEVGAETSELRWRPHSYALHTYSEDFFRSQYSPSPTCYGEPNAAAWECMTSFPPRTWRVDLFSTRWRDDAWLIERVVEPSQGDAWLMTCEQRFDGHTFDNGTSFECRRSEL